MEYTCRECGAPMITTEEVQKHRQDFPSHSPQIVGKVTPPEPIQTNRCQKCGNPEGYDHFVREDPPYYCCGECGEPEHPLEAKL